MLMPFFLGVFLNDSLFPQTKLERGWVGFARVAIIRSVLSVSLWIAIWNSEIKVKGQISHCCRDTHIFSINYEPITTTESKSIIKQHCNIIFRYLFTTGVHDLRLKFNGLLKVKGGLYLNNTMM